ncbi:MAG: AtpZ/AtpI family protein [Pseudomonadota bacterium]
MTSSDGIDPEPTGQRPALTPAELEDFSKRASELDAKLKKARGQDVGEDGETDKKAAEAAQTRQGREMGRALRLSTELIGGLVVGAGLGVLLDELLGTWPAMFIIFFLLGAAAGIVNLTRTAFATPPEPSSPRPGANKRDDTKANAPDA